MIRRSAERTNCPTNDHAPSHHHRRRPRRRHHGRPDRGALRERRSPRRACSTSRAKRRATGLTRAQSAQAGSVLHARHARADPDGRLRRGPRRSSPTADWIIEAIVERLDVKRALFERSTPSAAPTRSSARTPPAFRSAALAEGRTEGFRRHFARHALLQPAALPAPARADADTRHRSAVLETISTFADVRLGKGVVRREGHAELHREPPRASTA